MTPFLPTLFTIALAETGGGVARVSQKLAHNKVSTSSSFMALGLIATAAMGFAGASAIGIQLIEPMGVRARALLLGIALIWGGAGQITAPKEFSIAEGGRALVVALRSYARVFMGNRSTFIVFGIALVNGGDAITVLGATLGGILGIVAANLPPLLLPVRASINANLSAIRLLSGVILALIGFYFLLTALKLI